MKSLNTIALLFAGHQTFSCRRYWIGLWGADGNHVQILSYTPAWGLGQNQILYLGSLLAVEVV